LVALASLLPATETTAAPTVFGKASVKITQMARAHCPRPTKWMCLAESLNVLSLFCFFLFHIFPTGSVTPPSIQCLICVWELWGLVHNVRFVCFPCVLVRSVVLLGISETKVWLERALVSRQTRG
jgi:hypothetical protein